MGFPPRWETDPFPIPTRIIARGSLLEQSQDLSDLIELKLQEFDEMSDNAALSTRCSMADLEDSNSIAFDNPETTAELEDWHNERLSVGAILPSKSKSKRDQSEDREDSMQPEEDDSFVGTDLKSDSFLNLMQDYQNSTLKILQPIPDIQHFVRRSKLNDYNSLLKTIRPAGITLTNPAPDSELSNLIYTILILPISRTPIANGRNVFATRQQELVLSGSNTLKDLANNILAGGAAVPVREEIPNDSEDEEEDEAEEPVKKKMRWIDERRDVGTCFSIENVLYGDRGKDALESYAITMFKSIDPTQQTKKSTVNPRYLVTALPRALTAGTYPNPSIQAHVPELSTRIPTPAIVAPNYTLSKKKTDQVRLGELDVRVGEAYLYVHQANCEHVWIITSVRLSHPSDPTDLPVTTFLSKAPSANCTICSLDPVTKIVLNAVEVGCSPCPACERCWNALGGKEKNLEMIPILSEY